MLAQKSEPCDDEICITCTEGGLEIGLFLLFFAKSNLDLRIVFTRALFSNMLNHGVTLSFFVHWLDLFSDFAYSRL